MAIVEVEHEDRRRGCEVVGGSPFSATLSRDLVAVAHRLCRHRVASIRGAGRSTLCIHHDQGPLSKLSAEPLGKGMPALRGWRA